MNLYRSRNREERVILVDGRDVEIGTEEKMRAHRAARLHRAFSVFVFSSHGEMLLQQRASVKYHSPDLWTNTCCSHPRPGESTDGAAHRRMQEEMGFDCPRVPVHSFVYRADVGQGMYEHEFDHVYFGTSDDRPVPNDDEVGAWSWCPVERVLASVAREPHRFTVWFRLALGELTARGVLESWVPTLRQDAFAGERVFG